MTIWLENTFGAENAQFAQWGLTALGIIVFLLLAWWVIRMIRRPRYGNRKRGKQARLAVTDAAAVDSRRRLVLLRRDDVEHLIMIGGPTDIVIESDIRQNAPARPLNVPVVAETVATTAPIAAVSPAPAPPVSPAPVSPAPAIKATPPVQPTVAAKPPENELRVEPKANVTAPVIAAGASVAATTAKAGENIAETVSEAASGLAMPTTGSEKPATASEKSIQDDMNSLLSEFTPTKN